MKARSYRQAPDPGWVQLRRVFKIACCDCGLAHLWELMRRKRVYGFKVTRDNRATAQLRRNRAPKR